MLFLVKILSTDIGAVHSYSIWRREPGNTQKQTLFEFEGVFSLIFVIFK